MKKLKQCIYLLLILSDLSYGQATIGLLQNDTGSLEEGYVLFSPMSSTQTYLIDKCGKQVKTWTSAYRPGLSARLLPDGSLLRTGNTNNSFFNAGGKGGIIEKIDWNGNVTWSYILSDSLNCQHHDVTALPNGNILVIAWEAKTNNEAIAMGRNPALVPAILWSEQILEIEPVGNSGGNIVWEWHLWDHLVQDFDTTKPNFGAINSHPTKVNLNYKASATNSDWIHLNSIDYHAGLDQILLSAHGTNEIWIIDHSTSSVEAKGNSGGNSGLGGGILYRWGNPVAYNSGTATQFFGQHNAYWIEDGLPFQNQIMVFNNGNGRTGGNYSTIEIIKPPVDGFKYSMDLPFLPNATSWIYNSGNTQKMYAQNISGAQQLSKGNVLFTNGPSGVFTEVNSKGESLWSYVNPVSNSGILTQGTTPAQNTVFRSTFYPSDYSGFAGRTLVSGSTIENENLLSAYCANPITGLTEASALDDLVVYPNPTRENATIQLNDIGLDKYDIELLDINGSKVGDFKLQNYTLDLKSLSAGAYILKISNEKAHIEKRIIIQK